MDGSCRIFIKIFSKSILKELFKMILLKKYSLLVVVMESNFCKKDCFFKNYLIKVLLLGKT